MRDQREREAAASPQVFKLRQFTNIPSRFHQELPRQDGTCGLDGQAWEPLPGPPLGFDDSCAHTPGRTRAPYSPGFMSGLVTPPRLTPPQLKRSNSVPLAFGSRVPDTPQARKLLGETTCCSSPPKTPSRSFSSGAVGNATATHRTSSAPRSASRGTPFSQSRRSPTSAFESPVVLSGDEDFLDVDAFERGAIQLKRNRGYGRRPAARNLDFRPERRPIGLRADQPHGRQRADLGHQEDAWRAVDAEIEFQKPEPVAIPPGYRLLPDQERGETLHTLRTKLAELDAQYSRLPLAIETAGQRQQQQRLREKIAETEAAVKVFSRPAVLLEL